MTKIASRYFGILKRLDGVKLKLRISLITLKKGAKTVRTPDRLMTSTISCINRKIVIELIMNLIDLIRLHLFKLPHYSHLLRVKCYSYIAGKRLLEVEIPSCDQFVDIEI